MALLKNLKIDTELESGGVWVDWIQGVQLKIGRANNPAFIAAIQRLSEPDLEEIRKKDADPEILERATKGAVAEAILLGWKGIDDDNGKPIKYSVEKALELISDPGLRDLYGFVLVYANDSDHYRRKVELDTAKN